MEDLKKYHEFINDFWQYIKTFNEIMDDNEYWDKLFDYGNALYEKHKFPLAKDLIIAFMKNREKEWKDEK